MHNVVNLPADIKTQNEEFPTKMAREAYRYASLGWKVFPLRSGEKTPLGGHGFKDATSDPAKVIEIWSNNPNANIGLAMGEFVVVDVDSAKGEQFLKDLLGVSSVSELTPLAQRTPSKGWHLLFKRSGMVIRNDAKDIADGIDTRGTYPDGTPKGYIAVAPSRAASKDGTVGDYRWIEPLTAQLLASVPEMPSKLAYLATFSRREREVIGGDPGLKSKIDAVTPQEWRGTWDEYRPAPIRSKGGISHVPFEHPYVQTVIDNICDEIAGLPIGKQRDGLVCGPGFQLGNFLQSCGLTDQEIVDEVINRAVEAGLSIKNDPRDYRGKWTEEPRGRAKGLRELLTSGVWEGIERGNRPPPKLDKSRPKEQNGKSQPQEQRESKGALKVVRLSDIEPEETKWLWHPFFALGTIAAVGGDPGIGKSQLMLDLAARVTTGESFPNAKTNWSAPGDRKPASVVVIAGEDDLSRTVAPRFQAAGGDANRIHFIQGREATLEDGTKTLTPISLQNAIGQLDGLLSEIGDVRLVIIDPISAYMGAADAHKNADVRAALFPLQALAEKHDCCIVYVTHLNKSGDKKSRNPLHRFTDSLAFTAAARAAFLVTKDPSPQAVDGARLLTTAKNNLAKEHGMEFLVEEDQAKFERKGKTVAIPTSRIQWGEPTTVSAAQAMGGDQSEGASDLEDAKEFLTEELAFGPRKAREVEKAAKQKEISARTLRRARKALGIKPDRRGYGSDGWSEWSLPSGGPSKEEPAQCAGGETSQ